MPYHLIRLVSQNYKRVRAFELDTRGKPPLIEISGENSAGKSSACNSLLALLKFAELPKSETEPLREGAEKGFLYGGFGEKHGGDICLEVTRTFSNKGSLTLTVTDANKKKVPGGPQTVIDQFLSIVALRPNDIIDADKDELFDLLKKLAPMEVDLDELDRLNESDYRLRTDVNREIHQLEARISKTEFPADLPEYEIDISAISQEMEAAAKANTEITERQGRREREKTRAENLREQAKSLRQAAQDAKVRAADRQKAKIESLRSDAALARRDATRYREAEVERYRGLVLGEKRAVLACADRNREYAEQIESLKRQISGLIKKMEEIEAESAAHQSRSVEYSALIDKPQNIPDPPEAVQALKDAETCEAQAAALEIGTVPDPQDAIEALEMAQSRENEAVVCEKRLADAQPLPDPVDLSGFHQRVAEATRINDLVRQKASADKLAAELTAKRLESDKLTKAMERREEQKRKAIASAKMPIAGLSFGKGEVLWNGHPLAQAGTAEKWRVAISICIAQQPGLKAILVKDGSLLDKKTKKVISDMAEQNGYVVLMEEVDDSGKVGIYIEDGEISKDNYAAAGQLELKS